MWYNEGKNNILLPDISIGKTNNNKIYGIINVAEVGDITPGQKEEGLNNLTDVVISNPKDGETLIYDASSNKWRNESLSITSGVYNGESIDSFPEVGQSEVIYKDEKSKKIYQWNKNTLMYEEISANEDLLIDIILIDGGNANGYENA